MANEIKIQLKFKEYEFRRVKTMGGKPVAYTTLEWAKKEVIVIPLPFNITDRWIEKQFNQETGHYEITIESDTILKKRVGTLDNVGRIYIPKEYLGMDVLFIEPPKIPNLY